MPSSSCTNTSGRGRGTARRRCTGLIVHTHRRDEYPTRRDVRGDKRHIVAPQPATTSDNQRQPATTGPRQPHGRPVGRTRPPVSPGRARRRADPSDPSLLPHADRRVAPPIAKQVPTWRASPVASTTHGRGCVGTIPTPSPISPPRTTTPSSGSCARARGDRVRGDQVAGAGDHCRRPRPQGRLVVHGPPSRASTTPIHCRGASRRPPSPGAVDENVETAGHDFFSLGCRDVRRPLIAAWATASWQQAHARCDLAPAPTCPTCWRHLCLGWIGLVERRALLL
jgi:hypothetical protein